MFKSLSGYRTYICAAALIFIAGLHATGHIGDQTFQLLTDLCGAGGLIALRSALKK